MIYYNDIPLIELKGVKILNDDLKIAIEKTTQYILSLLPNDVKTDIMNTKEEDLAIFHFNIGILFLLN